MRALHRGWVQGRGGVGWLGVQGGVELQGAWSRGWRGGHVGVEAVVTSWSVLL